jgi:hypothetical protein
MMDSEGYNNGTAILKNNIVFANKGVFNID